MNYKECALFRVEEERADDPDGGTFDILEYDELVTRYPWIPDWLPTNPDGHFKVTIESDLNKLTIYMLDGCCEEDEAVTELGLEMTDLIAGDEELDGVYLAMAWELGEW